MHYAINDTKAYNFCTNIKHSPGEIHIYTKTNRLFLIRNVGVCDLLDGTEHLLLSFTTAHYWQPGLMETVVHHS